MTDTNVFQLSQPGSSTDPMTEVLRNGARALLAGDRGSVAQNPRPALLGAQDRQCWR